MQKLRKLTFFDRCVISLRERVASRNSVDAQPSNNLPSTFDKNDNPSTLEASNDRFTTNFAFGSKGEKIVCACGSNEAVWFGDSQGMLYWFYATYIVDCMQSFSGTFNFIKFLPERNFLVCVGEDNAPDSNGETKYQCYFISSTAKCSYPVLIREAKLFSTQSFEKAVTCFDSNAAFNMIALGTQNSGTCLFRGDLIQEKTCRMRTIRDDNSSVVNVHFLMNNNKQILLICTTLSITSYFVPDRGDLEILFCDSSFSNAPFCSTVNYQVSNLLVLGNEAVFTFDAEQGNLSALPCDGRNVALTTHKYYFVAVTQDTAATVHSSSLQRQTVSVCLSLPEVRFLAFSGSFTDITQIVSAMNGIVIFSHDEMNHSLIIHKLREKYITSRLDILVKKRLFDWATAIALKEKQNEDVYQEIYRLHGDWLYEKRFYDQALTIYLRTIGYIEPSYVIEKYLDAQRIHNLAEYLMKVHEAGLAVKEHTTMLFKCYTMLQEISKINDFIKIASVHNYDLRAAIETCRDSGYSKFALDIALSQSYHDMYVTILIEDCKNFNKAIQYMRTLSPPIACTLIMKFGRTLIKHQPDSSLAFINQIMRDYKPGVEVFIPLFLDCNDRLLVFLSTLLQSYPDANEANTGSLSAGSTAVLTYLELLLRSYKHACDTSKFAEETSANGHGQADDLVKNGYQESKTLADLNVTSSLGQSIMKLLKEHCTKEEDIHAALNLCHAYEFEPGLLYCSKKSHNYQLPLGFYIHEKNLDGLLNYCLECGLNDPILWTEALSFFASLSNSQLAMLEVLKHIGKHRLLPPLGVLDILKEHPNITFSAVKEYLLSSFDRSSTSLDDISVRLERDNSEIERMREDLTKIKSSVKLFQQQKCSQCTLALDFPSVYFYCGHSYHMYCLSSDSWCQKCEANIRSKKMMLEQRELQGRNAEDFFKFLRGSVDGLDYIASCFGKGMFSETM